MRRSEIVISAAVEMLIGMTGILIVTGLFTWVPARAVGTDLTIGQTASGLVALLPFGPYFGAVALLASSLVRRSGVATSIAGGMLVAMYFVNGFAGLQPPRYLWVGRYGAVLSIVTMTVVPLPGSDSISSFAPILSALRGMFTRPKPLPLVVRSNPAPSSVIFITN